ncbi:hypothetical protein DS893_12710 [Vibrionales bacterium C3R12]|nr:hypothetical protein DS893_12710 [Vibrionales bacterium C3R12]
MEWNVNTYKQISQQVLKFEKCIDHLASLHEIDDLHRLTMPKKAENVYEAFKGIQAQSNIILVYCVAVSMLDLIQDLLTDCADGVFESHADIYNSATELTATLTSLIETLAPKVLAPAFSLHAKYIEEIDEKKSELHDAEHKLNEGIQRLQLVEDELKQTHKSTLLIEENINHAGNRLLSKNQQTLDSRISAAQDEIQSILRSAQDDFNVYTSRSERKIEELMAKAENQNQIHTSDINDLFNAHEKESTNRIEVRIQRAEGIAANLSKQASDAKELYDDIASEQKESFHAFIQDSQSSINDSIRKTSTEASQKVQKAQIDAQESFNTFLNENITSINERIEEKVSEYDDLKKTMESTFQEKIDSLEDQLSIVTSGVMADQHIKQANTERRAYWALQLTGFAFMLAAIYAGSLFFSELTNVHIPFLPKPDLVIHIDGALYSGLNLTTLLFMRLSMIILLTAPAIYLLKEAAGHRHKENLYRQRGIQLATISPYLEELEKEERAAIKKELVKSFFNFHDGKADTQNVPDFLRDMKEAVGIAKSLNGQTKTVSQRFGRKPK